MITKKNYDPRDKSLIAAAVALPEILVRGCGWLPGGGHCRFAVRVVGQGW
jgi:hypothetical protein